MAAALPGRLAAQPAPLTPRQYQEDFDFLWNTVHDDYAYFDRKQTDWNKVRTCYRPQTDTLRSRQAFVRLLENTLAELYDDHAGLGTNRPDSRRLVPSARPSTSSCAITTPASFPTPFWQRPWKSWPARSSSHRRHYLSHARPLPSHPWQHEFQRRPHPSHACPRPSQR